MDPETKGVVRAHPALLNQARSLEVDNGDVAMSRNNGVAASTGEILCILDGDDYYSKNWIERNVYFIRKYGEDVILHPELAISFGSKIECQRNIDQTAPAYDAADLLLHNYWAVWTSSRRTTYERCPYQRRGPSTSGFGYEDWHWNCETIARGYKHRIGEIL
ncbi:MAG: glycosyltransferase family A protein [Bradyrhizobium sp.]|nr:glycosyltransferase family A protein [Bradyrhizobium sp.]